MLYAELIQIYRPIRSTCFVFLAECLPTADRLPFAVFAMDGNDNDLLDSFPTRTEAEAYYRDAADFCREGKAEWDTEQSVQITEAGLQALDIVPCPECDDNPFADCDTCYERRRKRGAVYGLIQREGTRTQN